MPADPRKVELAHAMARSAAHTAWALVFCSSADSRTHAIEAYVDALEAERQARADIASTKGE